MVSYKVEVIARGERRVLEAVAYRVGRFAVRPGFGATLHLGNAQNAASMAPGHCFVDHIPSRWSLMPAPSIRDAYFFADEFSIHIDAQTRRAVEYRFDSLGMIEWLQAMAVCGPDQRMTLNQWRRAAVPQVFYGNRMENVL